MAGDTRLEIAAMLLATRYRDSYAMYHHSKALERIPYPDYTSPNVTAEDCRNAEKAREALAMDLICEECLDLADLLIKKNAREYPDATPKAAPARGGGSDTTPDHLPPGSG